jgi:hypothetical protein
MSIIKIFLLTIVFSLLAIADQSQRVADDLAIENEIRKLENDQIEYLLKGQVQLMEKHWAPGYTVNNPFNEIVDARHGPIRTEKLTYSKFDRDIQKVIVRGSTVIVMGNETVVPKGSSRDAGRTIHRRFTDIWMILDGKWLMVARHANEICSS